MGSLQSPTADGLSSAEATRLVSIGSMRCHMLSGISTGANGSFAIPSRMPSLGGIIIVNRIGSPMSSRKRRGIGDHSRFIFFPPTTFPVTPSSLVVRDFLISRSDYVFRGCFESLELLPTLHPPFNHSLRFVLLLIPSTRIPSSPCVVSAPLPGHTLAQTRRRMCITITHGLYTCRLSISTHNTQDGYSGSMFSVDKHICL